MSDPTAARDHAIEMVRQQVPAPAPVAARVVDALLADPALLRALAGAPTADVASVPVCPDHQIPGAGGRPIASPQMGCVACAAWMAAPEGVDAADESVKSFTKRWADVIDVAIDTEDWSLVEELRDSIHGKHGEAWADGTHLEAQGEMADELTAAQAAIQRVRARCDERESRREWLGEHADWVAIAEIRRALDGDTTEEKR